MKTVSDIASVLAGRGGVATTRWLNIEFSSKCVLRCKWCSLDHKKKPVFLEKGLLARLIDEVTDSGQFALEQIDLHNAGETLLHPDVGGMLGVIAAKRRGRAAFPKVNLLTNAVLLDEAMSATLLGSGALDLVRFSVDGGTPEAFEEMRTGAKWHKVSANVRRFVELNEKAGNPVRTGIICIIPPERPKTTGWMDEEFRELLLAVDDYVLRYPHNWDGSLDLGLEPGYVEGIGKKSRAKLCKFLVKNLVVLPDGRVTVCCADLNARGVIGSLRENTLYELYSSSRRLDMLGLYRKGRKAEIELCRACTGYHDSLAASIYGSIKKRIGR